MQFCNRCKVKITGNKHFCPLCQGELEGEGEVQSEIFPKTKPKVAPDFLFLRLITFGAIALAVVSAALDVMIPTSVHWSLPVIGGVACAWVALAIAVTKKHNILKNIVWQLFIGTPIAVLWDVFTGMNGWSLDYVIPCACVAAMLTMGILARIMKIPSKEFIIYLVMDAVYGIVPLIFLLTGIINVTFPSVICVACSIISMAALLLFKGRVIKSEITKKLHL